MGEEVVVLNHRARRAALIRLARRSQIQKSDQRASHLLSQKKAREGTEQKVRRRPPLLGSERGDN